MSGTTISEIQFVITIFYFAVKCCTICFHTLLGDRHACNIEKAMHFLERRSDAAAGLITDWQRHCSQAITARQDLEEQPLTRQPSGPKQ